MLVPKGVGKGVSGLVPVGFGADVRGHGVEGVHGDGDAAADEEEEGAEHGEADVRHGADDEHQGAPSEGEDDADVGEDEGGFAADAGGSVSIMERGRLE